VIVLIVKYEVLPGKLDAVLGHLRTMAREVAETEPGCRHYQVSRSTEQENQLVLIGQYTDESSLAAQRETAHFKGIIEAQVIPLLAKRKRSFFTLAFD
jgi:autoinducer 2-degrading protein